MTPQIYLKFSDEIWQVKSETHFKSEPSELQTNCSSLALDLGLEVVGTRKFTYSILTLLCSISFDTANCH